MVAASEKMQQYFNAIDSDFSAAMNVAQAARARGLDPANTVEITPARDIASRVEGLVGPPGVAERIREIAKDKTREEASFLIGKQIVGGEFSYPLEAANDAERKQKLLEQAVRTGLALFTEGVVSAPIEGITKVLIKKNQDDTDYAAVYFSGPIRGAGGTGQAFAILLADYCRLLQGIGPYKASASEIARYIEESNLYAIKTRAGQYVPTEDEVRNIASNCPVAITGEPTEDYEVNVNKDVYNVENNRVRGGMCLVLSEGVCLKAAKVLKISKKAGLVWNWLEPLIKVTKTSAKQVELKPVEKYIDEIVGGRPIFAYPMRPGGFRLRYGRTAYTGIASKAIHPATMILLDNFIAVGTQMKIERPGKGCIATPCDEIEGPVVRLTGGDVVQVSSIEQAERVKPQVEKVLWVGDLLVNYGDFLKANHPLVPSAWCSEWYQRELEAQGVKKSIKELEALTIDDSFQLAKTFGVPLAPQHTFFWHDLTTPELKELAQGLCAGKLTVEWLQIKAYQFPLDAGGKKTKELLERLCIPHTVKQDAVHFEKDAALALLRTLGLLAGQTLSMDGFNAHYEESKNNMALLAQTAGVLIRKKAGLYIGASMGRPEKAKERKMKPPVHSLFPVGKWGGKTRGLMKAAESAKKLENGKIEVDIEIRGCPVCGRRTMGNRCRSCNEPSERRAQCTNAKCQKLNPVDYLLCRYCESTLKLHDNLVVDFAGELALAIDHARFKPDEIKAVQGLISAAKTPESLEKGILRAKHSLSVFRDGTCRFDGTEIPMTHFTPAEIGTPLEKLRDLGYDADRFGKPLTDIYQVCELKPQDVLLSQYGADYFMRIAQFVDDLLAYQYGLPAFYNAKTPQDMAGKLIIAIAPHTSAGIIGRVIGTTAARGLLAHPYLHCACRRNADGDEISFILLLDALLNFSKFFLPETRGGKMDAPLVLTTLLDPNEVDDEAHAMDTVNQYPLEFYHASLNMAAPGEIKIDNVQKRLNTPAQYEGIGYTHEGRMYGVMETQYVKLTNMTEKVDRELSLMRKIRAVDSQNAAEKIILSHFLPDLYGNLRKFSRQQFRCVDCSRKYRRVPLQGKCRGCGGKILLTINKGGIVKYLYISKKMTEDYDLPTYLKQRLLLIEKEINSVFEDDKSKQFSLADYA